MATSNPARRATAIGVAAVVLLAMIAAALIVGVGSHGPRARAGRPAAGGSTGPFGWLRPTPAPAGWLHATTAGSEATLFYPPGWTPIPGDTGTVTRSLRGSGGQYVGYLNVTPRQGNEQLAGWAAFRTAHNRAEGDKQVRQLGAAEGLRFRNAHGSCVIDDYLSKVGSNPYREIACLVAGRRHTDVFIGAALRSDWQTLRGVLERAASAFLHR